MSAAFVKAVSEALLPYADPLQAVRMEAYMKDKFPFLGVPAPIRRTATRPLLRPETANVPKIVRALWATDEREYHYVAIDILDKAAKALDAGETLRLFEELAQTKSWWDSVDGLSAIASVILRHNPAERGIVERWSAHENAWINRLAILHQKGWRGETDAATLFQICLAHAGNPDFFVRKAIGWALRDYAWAQPQAVQAFVAANRDRLSPLTQREALKNIRTIKHEETSR